MSVAVSHRNKPGVVDSRQKQVQQRNEHQLVDTPVRGRIERLWYTVHDNELNC